MNNKEEIEIELLSITERYINDFFASIDRSKDVLSSMIDRLNLMRELSSRLLDELVDTANKYLVKYDISDTSETEEFIQKCYLDFFESAKLAD